MPSKYPWAEWFRKRRLVLRKGTHYALPTRNFAQQVRNMSHHKRSGHSVTLDLTADTITLMRRHPRAHAQAEGSGS